MVSSKDPVQDEVSPENGPFTFNVFKQFELGGVVVESIWILVRHKRYPEPRNQYIPETLYQVFFNCKFFLIKINETIFYFILDITHLFWTMISIPNEATAAKSTLSESEDEDLLCFISTVH